MQAPVLVFDHVKKTATVVAAGPRAAKRLAELAVDGRAQVATSGVPKR
jgi:hypothetical protein